MTFQNTHIKVENTDLNYWFDKIQGLGIIAGGCIRSWFDDDPVRDIDIFVEEFEITEANNKFTQICNMITDDVFVEQFDNPLLRRFVSRTEPDGTPMSEISIDVIKPRDDRWMTTFGSAEQIISKFDFSVCRAAMLSHNMALVDEHFEKDIESKILRIENIVCPISTVKRIGKYGKYGYTIKASQVIKLFTEWELRPQEERDQLRDLLSRAESGKELSMEETLVMSQMLYVD